MADPFKKVTPGDPIEITAPTWNAFLDAGQAEQRRKHDRTSDKAGVFRQPVIIKVKNESGGPLPRSSILGLDEPMFLPDDSLDGFQREVVFRGIIPAAAHIGKFCVLIDPLEEDRIGRAYIEGACPVQLEMTDPYDTDCDVYSSHTESLQSMAGGGSGQILYKEDGTGLKWGTVRLNPPTNGIKRAITSGSISACSGTSAGTGTVKIWTTVNGTPTERGLNTSVNNWFTATIATGKHCHVAWVDGSWDIIAVDC